jgi:hypothetical protein
MTFALLVLAALSAAPEPLPVVEQLRQARSCHVGSYGNEEKIVCLFKLPGLAIEVTGVNEPAATFYVTELDPARWSDAAFMPGDPCVNIDRVDFPAVRGSGALIHVRTAKPYATAAECRKAGK